MKKLTILIILVVFALAGHAQGFFDIGPKVGFNTSKMPATTSGFTPETVNHYQLGAFARINLGRIYIQPEVYYNSKSGEEFNNINPSDINKFDLKTIDVPALLGFKIIDQKAVNLRILAGPVFSFLADKNAKGQFTEENIKNSFFGWQYGAGVDFLFLTLDARMETFSKDYYDKIDTKNGTFVISLGLKLF